MKNIGSIIPSHSKQVLIMNATAGKKTLSIRYQIPYAQHHLQSSYF